MLTRILVIIGLSVLLTGCPLEGNDGKNGTQGIQGVQGVNGPIGAAGISCWDLNENGQADLAAEDTNSDGTVNVKDCRANAIPAHTPAIARLGDDLDPTSPTYVLQHFHTRRSFGSYYADDTGSRIILAIEPAGIAVDPIQDACNLWKWTTDDAGFEFVTADNAYNYKSEHFPQWTRIEDPNNPGSMVTHPGFEFCESACLTDPDCDGAFYNTINNTENSIMCKLLTRYENVQPLSFHFKALGAEPAVKDAIASDIARGLVELGIISVCD